MAKLFANSGDPDQMLCSTVTDLGLHCLLITLLRVSQLQWVKSMFGRKFYARLEYVDDGQRNEQTIRQADREQDSYVTAT